MLNLTRSEFAAVCHRLDVPDALADALEETHDRSIVEAVAGALRRGDLTLALRVSDAATRDVLIDCIEGTTYAAAATHTFDQTVHARSMRTLNGAARKIGAFVGRAIEVPNY